MNKIFRLIAFLCLWSITSITCAESLSKTSFQYKGGKLGYLARNEVYSAWNTNNSSADFKSGMKVIFYGRADSCDFRASNGPVTNKGGSKISQALELTGIPLASKGNGQQWIPSGDTEQCDKSVRGQVGDSFVHVNEESVKSGIGLFTSTGIDKNGRRSFFRQFDKSGRAGKGANANIEGTFVAFRFDWQKGSTVKPWAGGASSVDQNLAEFRTVQSVAVVSLEDDKVSKKSELIQAKQQFIPAFINRACFLRWGGKGMCQLQYLFNTAIYRAGVTNWNSVAWFKKGGLLIDPGQAGMPVIHGPIGQFDQVVTDVNSGLSLYISQGESSQHTVFNDKEFRVQVSFAQLKNALKIIAAKKLKKSPSQVTNMDLGSLIGQGWDDPNEWLLLSVNLSQEVHNPNDNVRAYIGGSIKELEISSTTIKKN